MSNNMTVGSVHSAIVAPHAGIYEALLDKSERENAELADRLSGLELSTTQKLAELESKLNNMQDQRDFAMTVIKNLEKERDEIAALVRRLFALLETVEVSDSEREFHPTYISSCRVMHTQELNELLPKLKEAAK